MAQISLRISDELAEDVKADARRNKLSLNGYITQILKTASNPEFGGTEAERMRERFRRAGLLQEWPPFDGERPGREELEKARAEAGKGKALSEYVIEGRD